MKWTPQYGLCPEVMVDLRSNYGNEAIYPANATAELALALTGRKTFKRADLSVLERLGFAITVKQKELV